MEDLMNVSAEAGKIQYPKDATVEQKLEQAEKLVNHYQSVADKSKQNFSDELKGMRADMESKFDALKGEIKPPVKEEPLVRPARPDIQKPVRPTDFDATLAITDPESSSWKYNQELANYNNVANSYNEKLADYNSKSIEKTTKTVSDFMVEQNRQKEVNAHNEKLAAEQKYHIEKFMATGMGEEEAKAMFSFATSDESTDHKNLIRYKNMLHPDKKTEEMRNNNLLDSPPPPSVLPGEQEPGKKEGSFVGSMKNKITERKI
ncbi:hypothetical protein [Pseudoalteromonas sp.]|uniref:hypothetical protein n=1 Tax=Pseudoalteromonas sp. TaxID=53249 RepID=UPI002636E2D8|nr:hypothetical protein [Pseudoalteromonas sp.]MCP4588737.1 hypothetical protein [Pseudoalteromonas sp.]